MYVRKLGTNIIVYVMNEEKDKVARVTIPNNGNGTPTITEENQAEGILDMVYHPTEDCLAVLDDNSINLLFKSGGNFEIDLLPSALPIRSGNVRAISHDGTVSYFSFFIQGEK